MRGCIIVNKIVLPLSSGQFAEELFHVRCQTTLILIDCKPAGGMRGINRNKAVFFPCYEFLHIRSDIDHLGFSRRRYGNSHSINLRSAALQSSSFLSCFFRLSDDQTSWFGLRSRGFPVSGCLSSQKQHQGSFPGHRKLQPSSAFLL